MREFSDAAGRAWIADVREENTPRHHGRWYLIFHSSDEPERVMPMPEVRWQTRATGQRTLATMSLFELRRRLASVLARAGSSGEPAPADAGTPASRARSNAHSG